MLPMLSIDFGNSFTKVALRAGRDVTTMHLKDPSLKWDDSNICVPTLAASYEEKGNLVWRYGIDVLSVRQNARGLTVHRNWKPHFFNPPSDRDPCAGREPAIDRILTYL